MNRSEYLKQYRLNNKEKIKAYCKQYRLNNKEKIKQYYLDNKERIYAGRNKENLHERRKKYYQNHKEKFSKKNKKRYVKNREQIKQSKKKYYQENKIKAKARAKEYYIKNKEHINKRCAAYTKQYLTTEHGKLTRNLLRQKRRAHKVSTDDGSVTKEFIRGLFIKQKHKCKLCKCNIEKKYHMDHIIPLSRGGNHISTNIQLLCPLCNLKKHNKILS